MTPTDPFGRHASSPAEVKAAIEISRSGKPFLAWRDGDNALHHLPLDASRPTVTIGRSPSSTIALVWDPKVSALHAEVTPVDAEWVIADDGLSKNGTFVGGERIASRRRLRDDDRIVVGTSTLRYQAAAVEDTETELAGTNIIRRSALSEVELSVLASLCAPLLLEQSDEAASNQVIANQVNYTVHGVKRCLTRLYKKFRITADPKRTRLAKQAISTGLIGRGDCER